MHSVTNFSPVASGKGVAKNIYVVKTNHHGNSCVFSYPVDLSSTGTPVGEGNHGEIETAGRTFGHHLNEKRVSQQDAREKNKAESQRLAQQQARDRFRLWSRLQAERAACEREKQALQRQAELDAKNCATPHVRQSGLPAHCDSAQHCPAADISANGKPPAGVCANSASVPPSLAEVNAPRDIAPAVRSSGVATLATVVAEGGLASAVGSRVQSVGIHAAISELKAAALGMARLPLGMGLLAYSGKAGEGSDKVPGRDVSQLATAAAAINAAGTVAAGYGREAVLNGGNGFALGGEICEGTREQCGMRDGTRRPERTALPATNDNLVRRAQLNAVPVRAANAALNVSVSSGKPHPAPRRATQASDTRAQAFAQTPASPNAATLVSPLNWQNVSMATKEGVKALKASAAASPIGAKVTTVAVGLHPLKAGEGSSLPGAKHYRQTLPADALNLPAAKELAIAANNHTTIESEFRGRLRIDGQRVQLELVKTAEKTPIRVFKGEPAGNGVFRCSIPPAGGLPGRTIFVTPEKAPGAQGLGALVTPSDAPKSLSHTGNEAKPVTLPTVLPFPANDECDFNDLIVVPPSDSGYRPVYVMLQGPRDLPGVVTGRGQEVGDNWLRDAATENGAPIPAQIADKLRGRQFSSFKAFRKAFWLELSSSPELSNQFGEAASENLRKGSAPVTREAEWVGQRRKFEIHHMQPIQHDGAVYDIDNLRVLSPKQHIEAHSNKGSK
ncbi:S-type pyocin domain-containing protein [Sodalis sp. RH22]|uniref:S-type pyocin domain-containing protein n=1 Tax=unclassified Sodalis (in: enterobacteria) TaxID=2636512 RepID=UPI0039B5F137